MFKRFVSASIVAALAFACIQINCMPSALACPFCSGAATTLTKDADQAVMILFGRLANAKLDPNDPATGTTELHIDSIVKSHGSVAGKKMIVLPRYIPPEKDAKFLVFCDFYQGKIDPYRGIAVRGDSRIAEYLKGALAVKDKDAPTRLRYFFDYLDDKDAEVSGDAFNEFALADYREYRPVAEKVSPDVIANWIRNPNTPSLRLGLYGSLLGHCGTKAHAKLLRESLADAEKHYASGVDGMLAGYILLEPKDGWKYLQSIIGDAQRDFLLRYAALRTARFFHDYRDDVIKPAEVVGAVSTLLEQKDIVDLAIEDLRKWGAWSVTDRVLALYGRKGFDAPIVKRSILRFALSCPPGNDRAAAFVAARRAEDAQNVDEVAELLRLESPKPTTSASVKPGK